MRRLFLRDSQSGDVVEDVFVLTNKQFSASSTGKFFIKAFVSDRTMQLTARMWNATREIFNALPENGFVRVRGRIENYQNNLQFIIEQLWPPKEGTFEIGDLMPQTEKDIPAMSAKVVELLGSIQNRHLAALTQAYLDDEPLMCSFAKSPAAMSFHHAFLGGLLEHTLNAMEVGDAVCKFYPRLNRDLIIAGIFLHDIAKTWELTYDCAFGYSDGGQLVGHIVKSAMWVEHKAKEAEKVLGEKIPQPLIDVVQHIIISHHGTPEFGAVKLPATPEAIAVHAIENLDAKLMMALESTRSEAAGDGNWTEYMKAFNGRLYRPDVAPADAADSEPIDEPAQVRPLAASAPTASAPAAAAMNPPAPAAPPAPPPSHKTITAPAAPAAPPAPVKLVINNPMFETTRVKK